jgi:pilus assembly protein CpaE
MVRANDKLSVLSAEAPINQPLLTDGSAFYQLQEEMRNAFETTVLDLPRSMLVQHPHLVHEVHVAVVVVEFTLAATRDAIRILSWLKANAPQARVLVVANKVPSGGVQEITRKDFEQSIERKVDIVIPFEPKAAAQAAKLGQPFAKAATAAKVSQPLNQLVQMTLATVTSEDEPEAKTARTASSLMGKLNIKSLMGKKTAAKAA